MRKIVFGWFVDWDGKARKAESPGYGYKAFLNESGFLEVEQSDGEIIFEATYYRTIAELENVLNNAGCKLVFA